MKETLICEIKKPFSKQTKRKIYCIVCQKSFLKTQGEKNPRAFLFTKKKQSQKNKEKNNNKKPKRERCKMENAPREKGKCGK